MGLDGTDGKAGCRWVSIRHGLSKNGNDHVHLAISMIREDGTWWSDYKSKFKSQKAARVIEKDLGLRVLGQGFKTKGTKPGELESLARRRAEAAYGREAKHNQAMVPWAMLDRAARNHLIGVQRTIEQPRVELARRLRGAGAGARSETEYVQRLRGSGLLVRPYFAKGSTTAVAGYSVAFRPQSGERPIWYGGGTLAKDLALPALREQWPEADPAAAVPEWKAAGKNKAFTTAVPAGSDVVSAEVVNAFFREMKDAAALFRDVNGTDPARFAQIARQGAGVLSAWSVAAGAEGDSAAKNLAAAADLFARHSQLAEEPKRAVLPTREIIAGIATHQAISLSRRAGASAILAAWSDFGTQLGKAFKAHDYGHTSDRLAREVREKLTAVQRAYLSVDGNPIRPHFGGTAPMKGTTDAAVAVLERRLTAPGEAAELVQKPRPRLEVLEEQLRAAGLPEQAIRARLQAEKIIPTGPRPAQGKAAVSKASRAPTQGPDQKAQQSRDQQKGGG
ncbi:hypothetical protein [Arthrobacter ulcerisalmonis]|uniref:hypothetical protein n=1 Tax=Arthrobacter ulcerisalmonis TaxID=2483813 RepID=UPI00363235C8